MALGILLSFLGLEGQTSCSIEDMPWSHQEPSTDEGRKMALDILLGLLGLEGQISSSLEDMP